MTEPANRTCTDCNRYAPRAARASIIGFQSAHPGWETVQEHEAEKIRKQFEFTVFADAIAFAERIVYLAKAEGHHPVIRMERNTMRVFVTWYTKEIKGIHNRDLLLAQQTDRLYDVGPDRGWPAVIKIDEIAEQRRS